ncbi:MAG: DUF308 domain-containing protein [Bacteroidales bacterium]|nr:DUF308 domain-containing protein [Bacteroidales bacterium]
MFKNTKISLIIRGIAFAALGILCFCFPMDTMEVFAKIAGVVVIITGLVFFFLQYKATLRSLETTALSATVLMVALGVLIVIHPEIIAILLGVFILFEGIDFSLNTIKYYRAKSKGWWLMLLLGLLTIAFGACSIFVPDLAPTILSILFGLSFLSIGCASFTALAGLNLVEDYFEAARRTLEEKDTEYVEAEVVK